ncbi:MAG TPA: FkbM family methyltransferase [Nitrococcus sp.]|nr:FkbM family methyltransferase [Nitrococcus sp.]
MLDESEAMKRGLIAAADTRRKLDIAMAEIAHLKRVNARYEAAIAAEHNARAGVQTFINELQRILFERAETTRQGESACMLVLGNQPPRDAIATLINLSEPDHGARAFQYMVPFLALSSPFPLSWPQGLSRLRIVDVGAQALDFESDIYAPLRDVAPTETIGFDPFATPSDAPGGLTQVRRSDGRVIQTYPCLLADGGEVTFYINRFDATSSTLPANHTLTRPFGLLDQAVETVTTRQLTSRRLDDVLADDEAVDLLKIDVQGTAHTVLDNAHALLGRTLICHVEAEFAPVYLDQRLFADVDALLREAGFAFVDFFSLGRQRYASFDTSAARAFHRGRTLWADCVYMRGLDSPDILTADELFRASVIMHTCYNKQDLAAELLRRSDSMTGGALRDGYIRGLAPRQHGD